jgi:hypothetical protein
MSSYISFHKRSYESNKKNLKKKKL